MTVLEKYSKALRSRDLRQHRQDSDIDTVAAAGLEAGLAVEVARSDAGDLHAQHRAAGFLVLRIKSYAWREHRTKVSDKQAFDVAMLVLGQRRMRCEPCGGRGFRKLGSAPTLGPVCSDCGGRGRPDLARITGKRCLTAAAARIDVWIEKAQDDFAYSMRKRLRD